MKERHFQDIWRFLKQGEDGRNFFRNFYANFLFFHILNVYVFLRVRSRFLPNYQNSKVNKLILNCYDSLQGFVVLRLLVNWIFFLMSSVPFCVSRRRSLALLSFILPLHRHGNNNDGSLTPFVLVKRRTLLAKSTGSTWQVVLTVRSANVARV